MGFNHCWISLLLVCVTTVSYSILVNGELKGMIIPTRGIWQGDHLSPFLFLFCTEGLHGLISQVAHNGDIHGFQLCRRSPKLTHLLFANDSLLFCKSDIDECQRVLDILGVYEKCSGKQINRSKTTIYFNKSITDDRRHAIKELLGVPEFESMRGTWVYHLLWERRRKQALSILRRGYGGNYKDGGKNYSLKRVGKF